MSAVVIQSLPSGAADATRLAARLGVPMHEIALHRFPDGELRVTVGPAAATTILYASLDRPNDKLIALLFAAEALRRDGAKRLGAGRALSLLHAPGCGVPAGRGDQPEGRSAGCSPAIVDRVITVDAHLHRTADIASVFPGIEADNLSAMPAIADALRAAGLDAETVVVGPDAESRAVGERSRRAGSGCSCGCAQDPPRRPLGRHRIVRSAGFARAGRFCWSTTSSRRAAR